MALKMSNQVLTSKYYVNMYHKRCQDHCPQGGNPVAAGSPVVVVMVASACCVQGNDASCCFGGGATTISFLATASAATAASAATPTSSTSGATGKIAAVGYYFSIESGGFILVCFFFSRIVLQTSCRCNVRLGSFVPH